MAAVDVSLDLRSAGGRPAPGTLRVSGSGTPWRGEVRVTGYQHGSLARCECQQVIVAGIDRPDRRRVSGSATSMADRASHATNASELAAPTSRANFG